MKVEICFFKEIEPDLRSKLIMLWDKTYFSHVGIVFTNEKELPTLFHATPPKITIDSFEDWMKTHEIISSFSLTLNKPDDYVRGYILGNLGKSYSNSKVYFTQVLRKVFKNFKIQQEDKVICSELVLRFIRDLTSIEIPLDPETASPGELYAILTKIKVETNISEIK